MATDTQNREKLITEFYNAPAAALFSQDTIAAVRSCSPALLERDRWAGTGVPFLKLGRAVRYRKADVLAWLAQFEPQQSTSETKNQAAYKSKTSLYSEILGLGLNEFT